MVGMFTALDARFEMGRTHLALADLGLATANLDDSRSHFERARGFFLAPRVPKYVEITERLAREPGLSLSR